MQFVVVAEAKLHELDVASDEQQFLAKFYFAVVVFVEGVSEQFAQLQYGVLRFCRVDACQRVNIVEGVEQKVRI